jgi:hypothetical protein
MSAGNIRSEAGALWPRTRAEGPGRIDSYSGLSLQGSISLYAQAESVETVTNEGVKGKMDGTSFAAPQVVSNNFFMVMIGTAVRADSGWISCVLDKTTRLTDILGWACCISHSAPCSSRFDRSRGEGQY